MRLQARLLVLYGLLGSAFGPHVQEDDVGADGCANHNSDHNANQCTNRRADSIAHPDPHRQSYRQAYGAANTCTDPPSMRRRLARVP